MIRALRNKMGCQLDRACCAHRDEHLGSASIFGLSILDPMTGDVLYLFERAGECERQSALDCLKTSCKADCTFVFARNTLFLLKLEVLVALCHLYDVTLHAR